MASTERKSPRSGVEILALAAMGHRGDADAWNELGKIFHDEGDMSCAAKNFRKAAELGHAVAQYNLGLMTLYGRGISKSAEEAAKLFEQSAKGGYPYAQGILGHMYKQGKGVKQDNIEACAWLITAIANWQQAADLDLVCFTTAVFQCGSLHACMTKDDFEAAKARAAERTPNFQVAAADAPVPASPPPPFNAPIP